MKKIWIILFGSLFALAGCGATPEIEPAPAMETVVTPVIHPTKPAMDDLPDNLLAIVPDTLLALVKEDLATRLGVEMDVITPIFVVPAEWPDSSLGCPEPDMMYTQVITPGYQIRLMVDERPYIYHTDSDDHILYCPRGITLPVSPGEIQDGQPWMPVD
jgi:hypothetical protein